MSWRASLPRVFRNIGGFRGLDVTVLEAIYSVVSHFSMHTGQIILLTKIWKGDLGFFDMSGGTPRPRFRKRVNTRPTPR